MRQDKGISSRYRTAASPAVSIACKVIKVNCLLPTENGELWVGTDRGVVRWNGTELTQSGVPPSLSHIQALAMTSDRDSNIWVGTNSQGLLRLNAQGVSSLDEGALGTSEAVTAVFEDREGNLWVGSANGIERLRDSVFVTYSAPEGLPSEKNGPITASPTFIRRRNYAEAIEEFAKYQELNGEGQTAAQVRESFAKGGWQGFLRAMTGEQRPANLSGYEKVVFHAALGDKGKAFAELDKSYEVFGRVLKVDPLLDPFRDDPRFAELLRRVGLSQ